MAILSLSSQVAMGHVGNSATAFALRRLGHVVWDVPTTVLSFHPGHGRPEGKALECGAVSAIMRAIVARARPDMIFSGYLADATNGEMLARQLDRMRVDAPCRYVLDPVIGDAHTGRYVAPDVATVIRDTLMPRADIVLPNRFELGVLAGMPTATEREVTEAARHLLTLGPKTVICTSAPGPEDQAHVMVFQQTSAHRISMTAIPDAPHGTGDLFAGVFMARMLDGMPLHHAAALAAASVHAVIGWSRALGDGDLALVAAQSALLDPPLEAEITDLQPRAET
ncbi:MAG: pyridoxal kinase [Minwuia sp.]|nr:pyridoxal kinase [Minwuia sp.]